MAERQMRRAGALTMVVGLMLGLLGLVAMAAPASAAADTTGKVCNNQKDRPEQDCEGGNHHGDVTTSFDGDGNLVFDIVAANGFTVGWRQLYICIPGTAKSQGADCQGNTASVLDPRPQPGGLYDVTLPKDNTENAKDVTFACTKTDPIRAVVSASALPPAGTTFNWTLHLNTCGGGTDEAFGSSRNTPPDTETPRYQCLPATDVSQTGATLRGETTNGAVTRAVFAFTAPAGDTRTFADENAADGFSAAVTGLTANTVYTYKVDFFVGAAAQAAGTATGCQFTTNATPDTYACVAPTDVTATSATLKGSTSNGEVDGATFSLTPSQGATVPAGSEQGNTNTWTTAATGLKPATDYTYTVAFLDGTDTVGTASGTVCAFRTAAEQATVAGVVETRPAAPADAAPTVAVLPAANVAPSAAAAPATLPRTGVATDVLLPMGIALVLFGLAAVTLGGRREPITVLPRPEGSHYR